MHNGWLIGLLIVVAIIVVLVFSGGKKDEEESPKQSISSTEEKKGRVVEVNVANFDDEVLKSSKPVVVDFYAPWCGPCQVLAPRMESWARKYPQGKFCKVNVDDNQVLSVKYNVTLLPTVIVFKNGEETKRWVGIPQERELADALK